MMASVSNAGCDSRGGRAFVADQRLEPGREFRLADELPCARHANQTVAARGGFVFARQFFQRGGQRVFLHFLEGLDGFVTFRHARRRRPALRAVRWAFSGFWAENRMRLQNKFQFHV